MQVGDRLRATADIKLLDPLSFEPYVGVPRVSRGTVTRINESAKNKPFRVEFDNGETVMFMGDGPLATPDVLVLAEG